MSNVWSLGSVNVELTALKGEALDCELWRQRFVGNYFFGSNLCRTYVFRTQSGSRLLLFPRGIAQHVLFLLNLAVSVEPEASTYKKRQVRAMVPMSIFESFTSLYIQQLVLMLAHWLVLTITLTLTHAKTHTLDID